MKLSGWELNEGDESCTMGATESSQVDPLTRMYRPDPGTLSALERAELERLRRERARPIPPASPGLTLHPVLKLPPPAPPLWADTMSSRSSALTMLTEELSRAAVPLVLSEPKEMKPIEPVPITSEPGTEPQTGEVRLYVLRCRKLGTLDQCVYYVGRTHIGKSAQQRLEEHSKGIMAARWCQEHKPIAVEYDRLGSKFDEDSLTLQYMERYGIDAVRGGRWCHVVLSARDRDELAKIMRHANYKILAPEQLALICTRCDRPGHKVDSCYTKTHRDGSALPPAEPVK